MNHLSTITDVQLLWSLNTGLLALLIFFIKNWANKVDKKLDQKVDEKACIKQHTLSREACKDLSKHHHAPVDPKTGLGGEVIL